MPWHMKVHMSKVNCIEYCFAAGKRAIRTIGSLQYMDIETRIAFY